MRSVFTKILAVILVAVICVNLLVFGIFRAQRRSSGAAFQNILARYLNYLIDELGSPPDPGKARQNVHGGMISIKYNGKNGSWATEDAPAPPRSLRWREWEDHPHIRSALWRTRFLIEVQRPDATYVFTLGKHFDQEGERARFLVLLLLIFTTLVVLIYFAIRWILKPVKWLKQGVLEISRGNLTHRVPVKRSDEFKELAQAFNTMTQRIQDMLHVKQRLLLDMSHELRSPLTRMRVAVEFLPESHARSSILNDILEMEKMIAGVLDTARHHHHHAQLHLRAVDIAKIIKDLLPIYRGWNPGVIFHESDEDETAMVSGDPDQIKTVLQNVLNNALTYAKDQNRPVEITIRRDKKCVLVAISDFGIGIPEAELTRITEPFYRVDKSRSKNTGGYGLGLSICKTIMEAHGGMIKMESILGKGTTVTLFFPQDLFFPQERIADE
jgi:signal transduction histidine kinase